MEMVQIGRRNNLRVIRRFELGVHLDGGNWGEILLPRKFAPKDCEKDDQVDVFVYFDSEDRIIATTQTPFAMVDECANLEVVEVNRFGAFLNWGLPKDLLVPFREQRGKMQMGEWHIVYVYIDEKSNRIAASTKLDRFLNRFPAEYEIGQEVDLLVHSRSDLGYKSIINNEHWGVIFHSEIFQTLQIGQRISGYIKKIREDGKIDLMLHKPGFEKVVNLSDVISQKLAEAGGYLALTDKSSPEEISRILGVSKKTFKKAIGTLYKERKIAIEEKGIRLITKSD